MRPVCVCVREGEESSGVCVCEGEGGDMCVCEGEGGENSGMCVCEERGRRGVCVKGREERRW